MGETRVKHGDAYGSAEMQDLRCLVEILTAEHAAGLDQIDLARRLVALHEENGYQRRPAGLWFKLQERREVSGYVPLPDNHPVILGLAALKDEVDESEATKARHARKQSDAAYIKELEADCAALRRRVGELEDERASRYDVGAVAAVRS